MEFNTRFAKVDYAWKVSDAFTLTPWVAYRYSQPWFYPSKQETRDKDATRTSQGLTGTWDISKAWNLVFGYEGYKDSSTIHAATQTWNTATGKTLSFTDTAFFAQAMWITDIANVTLGGRYEKHSEAGSAFVPRFGITKVWDKFHVKFLAAKAFRTPVIENIDQSAAPIVSEKTTAIEMEMGYQLSSSLILTGNLFNLKIVDPIVYGNQAGGSYANLPETGTKGMEASLLWKTSWSSLTLTGAYYEAVNNQVPDYKVFTNEKTLVGAPRTKFTVYGNFKLTPSLSVAPSVIYSGVRYGYNADFVAAPGAFPATTVANLFCNYKVATFLTSFGVNNLTDTKHLYVGGYSSSQPPLPAQGREFIFRLGYNY
jgi:outer membrane receptor for ferrienterochelin and colicin